MGIGHAVVDYKDLFPVNKTADKIAVRFLRENGFDIANLKDKVLCLLLYTDFTEEEIPDVLLDTEEKLRQKKEQELISDEEVDEIEYLRCVFGWSDKTMKEFEYEYMSVDFKCLTLRVKYTSKDDDWADLEPEEKDKAFKEEMLGIIDEARTLVVRTQEKDKAAKQESAAVM